MTAVSLWFSHATVPAIAFHGFQPEIQNILPFLLELQVRHYTETSPSGSHRQGRTFHPFPSLLKEGTENWLFHPNHVGEGGARASRHATKFPAVLSGAAIYYFFSKILFLHNLYTHCGAQT